MKNSKMFDQYQEAINWMVRKSLDGWSCSPVEHKKDWTGKSYYEVWYSKGI